MWADQLKSKPDPVIETRTRGQKRKLFSPVGGLVKAGTMNISKQDQTAQIEYELNKVQLKREQSKAKPGPVKRGRNPDKVQLAKNKGSALASSSS